MDVYRRYRLNKILVWIWFWYTKKNRILPAKSKNKKKVEGHPWTNKYRWTRVNHVNSSNSPKRVIITLNSESVYKTCNECLISANHDMCVVNLNSVNATPTVVENLNKAKHVWKAIGKLFAIVGSQWRPTGCSKHMMGNCSRLKNYGKKFIGTVKFGSDHFGAIMGYGDYVIGDSVISRVYYVEGLGHSLFSVGQFSDSDFEVAFKKHSCFVRNMDGVDLLKGCRNINLYSISVDEMLRSSPICLLSKASKSKSWLWHHRLNHLNFGTINDLARKDLVRGLPRLKFEKVHLCSACQLKKRKKYTHKPKSKNIIMEVLHTLHIDLCGPMRVQSINGKKYILVIVDDFSRFTWVKFLRSKDETPEFVIDFLKQIQSVGIFHQKSIPRTPQQNDVVERQNRTLVEAARTMLIFSKVLIALCYPINDSEDLEKLQAKADIRFFVGYAPRKKVPADPIIITPGQLNSRLALTQVPTTTYVPPIDKDLEILFQPMFEGYFEQSRDSEPIPAATVVNAPIVSTNTNVSTTIAQDAPSTSYSLPSSEVYPPVFPQGVATGLTF
ncbi:retrovirus-related pol polyprotein from transposon TNT 1-94 [Tanacetum coccineum]